MHVPSPQSRLKLGLNGRRIGLPRQIRAGDSRQSEQVPIGQELLLLEQEEKRGDWPARKGEERIRAAAQFMREQPCSGKGGAPLWGRAQDEGLVEALPRGFDGEHFGEDADHGGHSVGNPGTSTSARCHCCTASTGGWFWPPK